MPESPQCQADKESRLDFHKLRIVNRNTIKTFPGSATSIQNSDQVRALWVEPPVEGPATLSGSLWGDQPPGVTASRKSRHSIMSCLQMPLLSLGLAVGPRFQARDLTNSQVAINQAKYASVQSPPETSSEIRDL